MSEEGFTGANGELDLAKVVARARALPLRERAGFVSALFQEHFVERQLRSPMDREVLLHDAASGTDRPFLLFTSNNYLGLAKHPHVRARVLEAIDRYGTGLGTTPVGGRTPLQAELEEAVARCLGMDDTLLFSSGYAANLAVLGTLPRKSDLVVGDQNLHTSLFDGARLHDARSLYFRHNDASDLGALLKRWADPGKGDVYVCVEGVYSMTGDVVPLPQVVEACRARGAILVLDDAHGTGVMGPRGGGTARHFGLEREVDLVTGCFSKAFAVAGGFVCGKRELIDLLRSFANTYLFSAALPPPQIAAALGALEVLEREPDRLERLRRNVATAVRKLAAAGVEVKAPAAILSLPVPRGMNVPAAKDRFRSAGLAVAHYAYPAVAAGADLFRVSITSEHTEADLDRLAACAAEVFRPHR